MRDPEPPSRGTRTRRRRALPYPAATLAGLLALATLGASAALQAQTSPGLLALTHATVIDGTGAAPLSNSTVLVRDGRIEAVYASGSRPTPDSARVEDLSGKWIIPGLFDAHVHITGDRSDMAYYRKLLGGLLRDGVTGIRDMAGDARVLGYLAREARLDTLASPYIYYSALMAGPTFFYEDSRVPSASAGVMLGSAPWMHAVDATTDIPMVVAEAKGTGATGVKLYANLPGSLVKAIAAEAERQGLLVWTHATIFPATPSDAVDAGATTLSHTPYLVWEAMPHVPTDYRSRAQGDYEHVKPDDPEIVALLEDMKQRGTILDATLRVFAREAEHAPDAVGAGIMPWSYAVTKEAHRMGVLIDAGTDSQGLPIGKDGPDASAGANVVDEMALLVEHCGFTPVEAIRSATQVAAMAVGQGARRGAIAPGMDADLVVLDADPTADVRNVRTVVEVMKGGRIYRPASVPR
jgi:imidazolonepropionase-like amidohydrolase